MIDPTNITNYSQFDHQLEELLCFWILADTGDHAGHYPYSSDHDRIEV